jgi:hypothetical protein
MKNALRIILGLLTVAVLGLCGAMIFTRSDSPHGGPIIVPTTGPVQPTTAPVEPSKAAVAKVSASIGEGTWEVGVDVKPGKYKTAGALQTGLGLCYWHTATDDTNLTIVAQGVVDKPNEPGRVTLKKGQFFKTTGCEPWVSVK